MKRIIRKSQKRLFYHSLSKKGWSFSSFKEDIDDFIFSVPLTNYVSER